MQTEIPLVKQHLSDVIWAFRGEGANAERFNRLTGQHSAFRLQPSTANNIAQGYSQIVRFFPEFVTFWLQSTTRSLPGAWPPLPGKALCFEDQYTSSGGQLYELMAGHDRFVADLRLVWSRLQMNAACRDLCVVILMISVPN